jgi:hypothetical protein
MTGEQLKLTGAATLEADASAAPTGNTHEPADPLLESDHERIARLAYSYWEARGGLDGSPDEDWFRAERELADTKANTNPASTSQEGE